MNRVTLCPHLLTVTVRSATARSVYDRHHMVWT
nr:MAG TPA: hypothetical protein [Bacteriophage sp.]